MSAWPRLAEFLAAHSNTPTLSVYLEAAPTDPAESRAVSLRMRDALEGVRAELKDAPRAVQRALDDCITDLIDVIPSAEHRSRREGWAFFRTVDGDRLIIDAPHRVETSAAWDIGPRVIPFLLAAEPESALVVQLDREHARIGLLHDRQVDTIVGSQPTR